MEYVIDCGPKMKVKHGDKVYIAYVRKYNSGDFDIEVYPEGHEELDVSEEVHEYAWKYFEDQGFI